MSATQIIDGVEWPATGTWRVDPDHAEVAFVARSFRLSRTRGRFTGVDGTVEVAADPTASSVDATIDMASEVSGSARRDNHLRSADFFDVDNHPTARFRSSGITIDDGSRGTITGELTVKGVTRPVELNVEYLGYADSDRAAFRATATVNRNDWSVRWGSPVVSEHIRLEIEVELIRP
jgi:polyisoprenoid-binding protein YceI